MAWVAITNSTRYQYNNAPADPGTTSFNKRTARELWLKQTNGIRTYAATGAKVYTNVRKITSPVNTIDIGEMSKSWWDNNV
jgi:hypothetical protein